MIFIYDKEKNELKIPKSTSFSKEKILEREDLEQWIAHRPEILGLEEKIIILTIEYDKFDKTKERLDLLGLDQMGNLIVIELKRDDSGKDVSIQAIKYAAYCSTLTLDDIIQIHSEYLLKEFNLHKAVEEIRKDFLQFLNDDVEDISNKPRIILLAKKYRPEVTATILWLRDFGIDITCIQFIPYIIEENQIAFESKILIPLPEAKSFIMQRERKNQGPKSPSRPTSEISVKDHISQKPELMVSLFNILAPKILALHKNMEEVPTPGYIAYKVFNNNVLEVQIQKSKINFVLSHPFSEYNKKGPIPEKLEAVPLSFGWGDKCRYNLYSQKDIPVVVDLIKQALDYVIQKRCL